MLDEDLWLVRQFLQGDNLIQSSGSGHLRASPEFLYHCMTGWTVVHNLGGGTYGLSMERNDMGLAAADQLRREILLVASQIGANVLPVSLRSYRSIVRPHSWLQAKVLEVNADLECVFQHTKSEAYYLSAYDSQESPKMYFLCELPHAVRTVDEAREALKPASVKAAEAAGTRVVRQGDIFAIESDLTARELLAMGAELIGPYDPRRSIYGTAHTATELARFPDGRMIARDTLIHQPGLVGRGGMPDHAPRKLSLATWWWLTRNTVPIVGKEGK